MTDWTNGINGFEHNADIYAREMSDNIIKRPRPKKFSKWHPNKFRPGREQGEADMTTNLTSKGHSETQTFRMLSPITASNSFIKARKHGKS